jgi:hypothetical protein
MIAGETAGFAVAASAGALVRLADAGLSLAYGLMVLAGAAEGADGARRGDRHLRGRRIPHSHDCGSYHRLGSHSTPSTAGVRDR